MKTLLGTKICMLYWRNYVKSGVSLYLKVPIQACFTVFKSTDTSLRVCKPDGELKSVMLNMPVSVLFAPNSWVSALLLFTCLYMFLSVSEQNCNRINGQMDKRNNETRQ